MLAAINNTRYRIVVHPRGFLVGQGPLTKFSWAGIENNAWEDEDFLKSFEEKGERLELAEGDVKTTSLKAIETKGEQTEYK
jgi:hypothetical protein